ncbi:MAG: shikimate dehydrogenase [Gammaproteobacteria bacterium]
MHAEFARQTGQHLDYGRLLAPLDGFESTTREFFAAGGAGANVTVPFKEQAARWVDRLDASARLAGAVNTIVVTNAVDANALKADAVKANPVKANSDAGSARVGYNTDGIGLVRDLEINLGWPLMGQRILLLGAGGAARGALLPLLARAPARLVVANRTVSRAQGLCAEFAAHLAALPAAAPAETLEAQAFTTLSGGFDIIINATSAGLSGGVPEIARDVAAGARCYDMVYGATTPFTRWAEASGAMATADGMGMLVEQAAEAFWLWRGVRPETRPVLAQLRLAR